MDKSSSTIQNYQIQNSADTSTVRILKQRTRAKLDLPYRIDPNTHLAISPKAILGEAILQAS